MARVSLPTADGTIERYRTGEPASFASRNTEAGPARSWNRVVYAAAHVVADPLADVSPWLEPALDWGATMAHRRYLWDLGLGVAEAMDTAQRGAGLDWRVSRELIERSLAEARNRPDALIACGAGTDQLVPSPSMTLDQVVAAYEEQLGFIEDHGGRVILMASRALAATARGRDDYIHVYERVLRQVSRPVILHWLGEMFDPTLHGYWGSANLVEAQEVCLELIRAHHEKIDGIKLSLLDKSIEIEMRRKLPVDVRMLTGDDFDFAELIAGDELGHSDALLGILDGIAPAAAAALDALAVDDAETFERILKPMVPLSRHIFAPPTRFYKTGLVFLAWLNGRQEHFVMVGGQQSARSVLHLSELFRLADRAGLLVDPELACHRQESLLRLHGIRPGSFSGA